MGKIKVFIIDDNVAARTMLSNMINTQDDMEVVGQGGSGQSSVPLIGDTQPDVALLEIETGDVIAINDIMAQIKAVDPKIHVVICASPNAGDLITPMNEIGAEDFIRKPYNRFNLFRTIRNVMSK